MPTTVQTRLPSARRFIDDYLARTGITGDPARRYLWTDAFAVQTCFGLARALEEPAYREKARELIELVHDHLGRFHPKDEREGRISGLPEAEAQQHPTAGGLRIGKALPERKAHEAQDQRLEWERDGQYFHYLTRWCNALLCAHAETEEAKYALWAAELVIAGGRFIHEEEGEPRMYWKMSTDLSRPLVSTMGAHDPLEGLICALSARRAAPDRVEALDPLIGGFEDLCFGRHWSTTDALGIGGLLLSTLRAARLAGEGTALPEAIGPAKLWAESLRSLQLFASQHYNETPASRRLAFRECGLSLGVRALYGSDAFPAAKQPLERFLPLATQLEDFWLEPRHQEASTWTDHLDINAVTLAGSLVAGEAGAVFG